MDELTRVLLIGDYSPFLTWLQLLLDEIPDIALMGIVKDGLGALGRVLVERPDIVIVGCQLLGTLEAETVETVRHLAAFASILIFADHDSAGGARSLLQAGAVGCLLTDSSTTDTIVEAIRDAGHASRQRRSTREPSPIGQPHSAVNRPPELTQRESQVLALLRGGASNKEISRTLKITERTVEFHVSNILRRTGQATRLQVALWASERVQSSRLNTN